MQENDLSSVVFGIFSLTLTVSSIYLKYQKNNPAKLFKKRSRSIPRLIFLIILPIGLFIIFLIRLIVYLF